MSKKIKTFFDISIINDIKKFSPHWGKLNSSPYTKWAKILNTIKIPANNLNDLIDEFEKHLALENLNIFDIYELYEYNSVPNDFKYCNNQNELLDTTIPDEVKIARSYNHDSIYKAFSIYYNQILEELYVLYKSEEINENYDLSVYKYDKQEMKFSLLYTTKINNFNTITYTLPSPGKKDIIIADWFKYIISTDYGIYKKIPLEYYDSKYDFNSNGIIDYDDIDYFVKNIYGKRTTTETLIYDIANDGYILDDDLAEITNRLGSNLRSSNIILINTENPNITKVTITGNNNGTIIMNIRDNESIFSDINNPIKELYYKRLNTVFKYSYNDHKIRYNVPEKCIKYTNDIDIRDILIIDDYMYVLTTNSILVYILASFCIDEPEYIIKLDANITNPLCFTIVDNMFIICDENKIYVTHPIYKKYIINSNGTYYTTCKIEDKELISVINVWNRFDDIGLLCGLNRLNGENNLLFKKRMYINAIIHGIDLPYRLKNFILNDFGLINDHLFINDRLIINYDNTDIIDTIYINDIVYNGEIKKSKNHIVLKLNENEVIKTIKIDDIYGNSKIIDFSLGMKYKSKYLNLRSSSYDELPQEIINSKIKLITDETIISENDENIPVIQKAKFEDDEFLVDKSGNYICGIIGNGLTLNSITTQSVSQKYSIFHIINYDNNNDFHNYISSRIKIEYKPKWVPLFEDGYFIISISNDYKLMAFSHNFVKINISELDPETNEIELEYIPKDNFLLFLGKDVVYNNEVSNIFKEVVSFNVYYDPILNKISLPSIPQDNDINIYYTSNSIKINNIDNLDINPLLIGSTNYFLCITPNEDDITKDDELGGIGNEGQILSNILIDADDYLAGSQMWINVKCFDQFGNLEVNKSIIIEIDRKFYDSNDQLIEIKSALYNINGFDIFVLSKEVRPDEYVYESDTLRRYKKDIILHSHKNNNYFNISNNIIIDENKYIHAYELETNCGYAIIKSRSKGTLKKENYISNKLTLTTDINGQISLIYIAPEYLPFYEIITIRAYDANNHNNFATKDIIIENSKFRKYYPLIPSAYNTYLTPHFQYIYISKEKKFYDIILYAEKVIGQESDIYINVETLNSIIIMKVKDFDTCLNINKNIASFNNRIKFEIIDFTYITSDKLKITIVIQDDNITDDMYVVFFETKDTITTIEGLTKYIL